MARGKVSILNGMRTAKLSCIEGLAPPGLKHRFLTYVEFLPKRDLNAFGEEFYFLYFTVRSITNIFYSLV